MTLFAIVHGSMAGSGAYTRLAKELDHRGHRALLVALPVDRPEGGWPSQQYLDRLVIQPGGEAEDRSEWRWQIEFYNHV